MTNRKRYPAVAYDRDTDGWEVTSRDVSQIQVATELAHSISNGIPCQGGPLPPQRADGTIGMSDGTSLSIVWGSAVQDDGSRTVLGWYECSR